MPLRRRSPSDEWQAALVRLNADWLDLKAGVAPDGDADLEGVDFSCFAVPPCPSCGGVVKPDVVFFGKNVPRQPVPEQPRYSLEQADAVLIVGSSLMLYSGFRFVETAARLGKPVAAVDLGRTRADGLRVDPPGPALRNRSVFSVITLGGGSFMWPIAGKASLAAGLVFAALGGPAMAACVGEAAVIVLPPGFCATIFADNIGHARQLVVAPNGVVYVNTWSGVYYDNDAPPPGGFLVALEGHERRRPRRCRRPLRRDCRHGRPWRHGHRSLQGCIFAESNDRIVRYPCSKTARSRRKPGPK